MAFREWPKVTKETKVPSIEIETLNQLIGSGDTATVETAVTELREALKDVPASGRSLAPHDREFVIPLSSHEQKERILAALTDLSIYPWEEQGQLIIDHARDLNKLRAAGFVVAVSEATTVPTADAGVGTTLRGEHAFPMQYPKKLADEIRDKFVPKVGAQPRAPEEVRADDEDSGIDTELAELVNRFDQGQIDQDDPEFRSRFGALPSLRLFPQAYVRSNGKVQEKRTGREITTAEQEALFAKAQAGDAAAITTLVRMNTGLVLKVVSRYTDRFGGDPDDLFQEGMMALLRSISDYEKGKASFSTFAIMRIEAQIRRMGYEQKLPIHRPIHNATLTSELQRAKNVGTQDGLMDPKKVLAELPNHRVASGDRNTGRIPMSGIGLDRLERLYLLNAAFDPVSDEEDNPIDQAQVPYGVLEEGSSPFDALVAEDLEQVIARQFDTLPEREALVLRLRFGIGYPEEHTLEEVGEQFGVSRERVRQIEASALRKLKHPARSRTLRWFIHSDPDQPFSYESWQKRRDRLYAAEMARNANIRRIAEMKETKLPDNLV